MSRAALQVLGPSAGGIRRHVATLTTGLRSRGWAVDVVGPAGVMDGLLPDALGAPVSLGRRAPAAIRALRPLVARHDVVHAHGLTAGWLAWAAGAGPKLVVTVHNLVLDEAAGRSAPVLRAMEGRLPARAQRTIVISEEMRSRFDPERTDSRFDVIPPVGPPPVVSRSTAEVRRSLDVADGVPLVVLVGRLHPQKDVGTLLRAASQLRTPAQVRIVGEGPERGRLEALAQTLDLGDQVRFVGAHDNTADFMAAADVVVMSSLWEGFGLVVAEALALGRPVVATAVGPVPQMVIDGQTGRLVPPGDPAAMAVAIDDLLDHPDHGAEMGRAGAMLVRPVVDVDALVQRVEQTYDLVTGPEPR